MSKKHVPAEMNQEQVKNLLKFIDATQSEKIKKTIFGQLGRQCFYCLKLDKWLKEFKGNPQVLDRVNVHHKSKYWQSLKFSKDKKKLILTGRKVKDCVCAFADCAKPPMSLCYYCCKNFQQEFFRTLFGKKVDVKITKSYLLGNERCSTVIRFV